MSRSEAIDLSDEEAISMIIFVGNHVKVSDIRSEHVVHTHIRLDT